MTQPMRIAVVGAGSWGTTVGALAAANTATTLWARRPDLAESIDRDHRNPDYLPDFPLPDTLRATSDLEKCVHDADVVVFGVPSQGLREAVEKAAPFLRPWVPVLSLTKGFEQGSLLRPTEVMAEILPGHPAGVLTGPNLAREIMSGQAAAAVVGMRSDVIACALQDVFRSGLFRVYTNSDVVGCEVGGALKNVIAIAAGMAEGLGVGDNTRAMVITRGLAELSRLGVAMGGRAETFAGLAGLGDLMATCLSPYSRNRSVGEQLGRGRTIQEILSGMHQVAEGVKTAKLVLELGERYDVDLPICEQIHAVCYEGRSPARAYGGLLRRKPGAEHEAG